MCMHVANSEAESAKRASRLAAMICKVRKKGCSVKQVIVLKFIAHQIWEYPIFLLVMVASRGQNHLGQETKLTCCGRSLVLDKALTMLVETCTGWSTRTSCTQWKLDVGWFESFSGNLVIGPAKSIGPSSAWLLGSGPCWISLQACCLQVTTCAMWRSGRLSFPVFGISTDTWTLTIAYMLMVWTPATAFHTSCMAMKAVAIVDVHLWLNLFSLSSPRKDWNIQMRAGNLILIVQLSSLISLGWFHIKTHITTSQSKTMIVSTSGTVWRHDLCWLASPPTFSTRGTPWMTCTNS